MANTAATQPDPAPETPPIVGASFEAASNGPTKIVLAGLFHEQPDLVTAEKTADEWQAELDGFLARRPA